MNPTPAVSAPVAVAVLGYGGLVPFVILCILGWIEPLHAHGWHHALSAYGAVILSFVGALHWGFSIASVHLDQRARTVGYVWSVVPALLAWISLLLPSLLASVLLVVCFIVHYGLDVRMTKAAALPSWYLPLRWRLTIIAVICIAVGEIL